MTQLITDSLPEDIHVHYCAYKNIEEEPTCFSEIEKERRARFKFDRHKVKFGKRITWVKQVLSEYITLPPSKIIFEYEEYGRPVVKGGSDYSFNYSHSSEYVLLVISKEGRVGCDIEIINPEIEALTLSHQFFSQSERDALHSYPKEKHVEVFFNLWSRKEAFIKAVGKGLGYGLDQFSIEEGNIIYPKVLFSKEEPSLFKVFSLDIVEGYKSAVVRMEK